jgi:LysR family glycine cleavage system transcriptional activator
VLRDLPNLDWLRVFAAAARAESFALAATELHVTPGAVSQRIKALEAVLGVALFRRHAQGVRLTEAGRLYAQRVLPPIEQLALASRDIRPAAGAQAIRLTVLPALAQLWLGPRMDDFHRRHASATVEIWADANVVDLPGSGFAFALRYGRPPFPGCVAEPLLPDQLVPVAAPAVAAHARDAGGLPIGVPLMRDTYWPGDLDDWLRHAGHARPPALIEQTFSLYVMAVEATLDGRGFMIGHSALVGDLIAAGRLVALSDRRAPAANGFHLVRDAAAPPSDLARAFGDWILAQAAATA